MMSREREEFFTYLSTITEDTDKIKELFEQYFCLLSEVNQRKNLFSRSTLSQEIWTKHFQDSLTPLSAGIDIKNKRILDFGTGGGLPGIPLAIIDSSSVICLLDRRTGKINEVQDIIEQLGIKNCYTMQGNLEEIYKNKSMKKFDVIVCRGVKMSKQLLDHLNSLLDHKGFMIFYKGRTIEEELAEKVSRTYTIDDSSWGFRQLVRINKYE